VGALLKTVRRLLPSDEDSGILGKGQSTALADAVGQGSFKDGNYDLAPFMASGSRHAGYLATWWAEA
jgi:hypothetical protein